MNVVDAASEREAELLAQIHVGLPEEIQQRLDVLIQKRRNNALTDDEWRELKSLTDQVELHDAQRLEYLTELARMRAVPLRRLIEQLGLKPIPHG